MSSLRKRPSQLRADGGSTSDQHDKSDNGTAATAAPVRQSSGSSEVAAATAPVSPSKGGEAAGAVLLVDSKEKWKSWRKRFYTTWAMLFGFLGLVAGGHYPMLILIFIVQTTMFYEIVRLGYVLSRERKLPGFRHLQWFWFATAQFFCYCRMCANAQLKWVPPLLLRNYQSMSFVFYIIGVVGFVFSLKNKHYKYQFGMFAWCHLAIVLVVVQSSFIIDNLFQGMIWLLLPHLLIITDDVMAYFFGFFWGRTPLIKLSPKKTWEGFIGATFSTLIMGFFLSRILASFDCLICPKTEFSFDFPVCERRWVFIPAVYDLPSWIATALVKVGLTDWTYVTISPIQWHGLAFGAFASLIAPFGGFFASGFKRGFKIKDFGDAIPGHGGVTDRMDCQIMMGLFAWVYIHNFILSVSDVTIAFDYFKALSSVEQIEVFAKIQELMAAKGAI